MSSDPQDKVPVTYIKAIACGGRHSAVVTDTGALLTFGWGLYGQCGHGSTDDEFSPNLVSSLRGVGVGGVPAGLWHTICNFACLLKVRSMLSVGFSLGNWEPALIKQRLFLGSSCPLWKTSIPN